MSRAALAAALALALGGCGGDRAGGVPRLVVSAASSLRAPLEAHAREFGAARVRLAVGGSDALAAQIRQGATPDVLVSADAALADRLHAEGRLERPVRVATNRLVLALGAATPARRLADVARPGTTVLLGSRTVPVGVYARKLLAQLPPRLRAGILANVRSTEPDVASVVGKLAAGAADAGFVYATDARAAGLRTVPLPPGATPTAVYAAGVVSGSGRPGVARAYIRSLLRGSAARALRAAGFGPARGGP